MLVSPDGNAFEIRGNRLQLKAAAPSLTLPAPRKGRRLGQDLYRKIPQVAGAVGLFADLENIADLAMLATLIRHDKLDEHAGWI